MLKWRTQVSMLLPESSLPGAYFLLLDNLRAVLSYLQLSSLQSRSICEDEPHMRRKVLGLAESLCRIKDVNTMLPISAARELVNDPFKFSERSKRWKIKSVYGDIGFLYRDDETVAYVASRMPAVFSACFRVLSEVRRRLPDFSPAKMLDFGAGTGSAFWAVREVWSKSLEKVNLVEPSQSMQRAGQTLVQGLDDLPIIHGYNSIQALTKCVGKSDRKHDLVIASYVVGEIPSLKDQITLVRQLWGLTRDVLVLIEPGTPQGSKIVSQMRSHILWMEKRKWQKLVKKNVTCKDLVSLRAAGAYIVAPCAHDGRCPLEKSGKYCHFVQRLQRTPSQRACKGPKGKALRGFEDEKFSFVVFRRGQRPQEPWPLESMKLETLEERHAERNTDAPEIELGDDGPDDDDDEEEEEEEEGEEEAHGANLGGGWGRIIFPPRRRGGHVILNVCRSVSQNGSEGSFENMTITRKKNPTLHLQARRSLWGDLWPF